MRVALLRWWDANEARQNVSIEGGPAVLAFDGNMWKYIATTMGTKTTVL